MRNALLLLLLLLALSGCGPSADRTYKLTDRMGYLYYDKADLDKGGPPDQAIQDAWAGRLVFVHKGEDRVRVIESDSKSVKVKLETGEHRGATGWMARKEWDEAGAEQAPVP